MEMEKRATNDGVDHQEDIKRDDTTGQKRQKRHVTFNRR